MGETTEKTGFFSRRLIKGATVGAALLFFFIGVFFWGGFNTAMEATNTLDFCISCHEMEDNVYKEFKHTIHNSNRTGVRAICSDCHVPDPWIHKIVRKIKASNEVLHKILGSIDTPEKFDKKRLTLAKNVWDEMKETDSRECRNCHSLESMNPAFQKPRARKQHLNAFKTGQTCIDCHKGIAHKDVRELLSDAEIEELEKPNPAFIRDIPEEYLYGLKLVEQREIEIKKREDLVKAKRKLQAQKTEEKVQKRIDEAVAAALANPGNGSKNSAVDKNPVSAIDKKPASKSNINWDKVPARDIGLFYPGQSSIEWTLTGKDHGGARPFIKLNDRCFNCHDNEIDKIGKLIVSGEKLEPKETLIPGKRGSIPVSVQASHDNENLYMRFEWENTEHTPAPFVDGGKMDPDNPMKLAIMFATDDVKYASQAGCWGTCHHDLNSMPHVPPDNKVKKYIDESRSKIEIKGRRGKKRGGWDKLKSADEIKAELSNGHFMDIVRYKSGENKSEDGHILDNRVMEGGQGAQFNAKLSGNTWVVEMQRKLKSDAAGDVSMELDKVYNFGFAIHDDYTSERFHHVSLGYRLGFDNTEVEVNATKQ